MSRKAQGTVLSDRLQPQLSQSSRTNELARSGYLSVHLVHKVTRAVGRVESIELGGEQPNLSSERIVRLSIKGSKQMGLCLPKPVIETCEKFVALLGGDDSAGAPIGRIRAALDQAHRFEVIEEVGHDCTVDSEVLGEGELAADGALSGG
jgi:hypothetical protein